MPPNTQEPEKKGFFDTLGGLWSDFDTWAEEPKNQQILLGGGSAIIANVLKNKGLLDSSAEKIGYQGKIPEYTARRTPIQHVYDPNRRPGSAGRRYFSDVEYTPESGGVASVVQPVPEGPIFEAPIPDDLVPDTPIPTLLPPPEFLLPPPEVLAQGYAEGGIAQLSEGRYLKGETDGMADEVPASIDGQEPAALSDGEFVIPADIVSHLGNGNSEAGAKALKEMMSRIRGERTGNNEQGKQIDPNNFLLA